MRIQETPSERIIFFLLFAFVICNLVMLGLWLDNQSANHWPDYAPQGGTELRYTPPLSGEPLIPLEEQVPQLNNVPLEQIVIISPVTAAHLQRIYAEGQAQGQNGNIFSKIGDSTIESPHFMDGLDHASYNLGAYAFMQPVVDHFSGSFAHQGMAVQRGLHSWSVFDPTWADNSTCHPGEGPANCEIRLRHPAFVFIRLGSNDVGSPDQFRENMRALLSYCLEKGIIPIIGTKADRNEGPQNINNQILRQLAEEYRVPLWDFDHLAQTLPNNGMRPDGVHLTYFPSLDYTQPDALQTGYGLHNLSALMTLYEILRVLSSP
jgi:hypothetical protein